MGRLAGDPAAGPRNEWEIGTPLVAFGHPLSPSLYRKTERSSSGRCRRRGARLGRLVGGALEVENLGRHVGVRVDARHERPDPAPGYPHHGLAKVVLADMLEE